MKIYNTPRILTAAEKYAKRLADRAARNAAPVAARTALNAPEVPEVPEAPVVEEETPEDIPLWWPGYGEEE